MDVEAKMRNAAIQAREAEAERAEEEAKKRLAEVFAKMHEEVAEQKEAMARLMEVEARKLDARAQDRETEAHFKYEEANKKEEAAHDLEEKVRQSLIEAERRIHEAALAKMRNEEEYRSFQERRNAIDILEDVDVVELQQKLAAAGEQEKHLRGEILELTVEIDKLRTGGSNRSSQLSKGSTNKNSPSSTGDRRNFDFPPESSLRQKC